MADVVAVDEAAVAASGETTPSVASLQRPADGRGDGAGLAANVEGGGPLVLHDANHGGVAAREGTPAA